MSGVGRGAVLLLAVLAAPAPSARAQCDRLPSCELVWADEFDGAALDLSKWEVMLGTGTTYGLPAGWGNNELQSYQAANAEVAGGLLTMTARRESAAGSEYTSARLRTRGKGEWTYGRVEMRARLPIGRGLWPAFWMLPTSAAYGAWAASGEIDIMEYLGSEPSRVLGTLHYGARWPQNVFSSNDYFLPGGASFHDDFHTFAVEWERGEIRWYVDGRHYATQTEWFSSAAPYPAPFDVDFHLLVNLAVGGNFPGAPDASTQFPQEYVIDWIRVYQSVFPQGTQSASRDVSFPEPVRMRDARAVLITTFENQALARDDPDQPRNLSCAVGALGGAPSASAVRTKGTLELQLVGEDAGVRWRGRVLRAKLDRTGAASVDSAVIAELVDEVAGTPAQLRVAFAGRGAKRVSRVTLDCLQWRDEEEAAAH